MDTGESSHYFDQLKDKWDYLHNETSSFRYKLNILKQKYVDNMFLIQLNPDRGSNRRVPETIESIKQPYNPNKFNFNKVSNEEVIFDIDAEDSECHQILINASPISQYHSLLCPSVTKELPQILTQHSVKLCIELMFLFQTRDLRIGFNSLCAFASVNHLHYHLLVEPNDLAIEKIPSIHLKGPLHILKDFYLPPAFLFHLNHRKDIDQAAQNVQKLADVLLSRNIAHNVMMTRACVDGESCLRIAVWPRKGNYGFKKTTAFNVALCELSGWFPVFDDAVYENISPASIKEELEKWKLEDDQFQTLCKEIKDLF